MVKPYKENLVCRYVFEKEKKKDKKKEIQETPPPKDRQFSVLIRMQVYVLVGREAPEKFALLLFFSFYDF